MLKQRLEAKTKQEAEQLQMLKIDNKTTTQGIQWQNCPDHTINAEESPNDIPAKDWQKQQCQVCLLKSLQPYIGYLHLTKNLTMKLLYLSWLLKSSRTQQKTNQPDCERPDGTSMPQQSSETEYLGHWINQMKAVTKKKEVIWIWNS